MYSKHRPKRYLDITISALPGSPVNARQGIAHLHSPRLKRIDMLLGPSEPSVYLVYRCTELASIDRGWLEHAL